jgi:DNA-binding YbaB/EbfC family protein
MNNLQQLMPMLQQLQARIAKFQESLGTQKISASSGGGMVSATVDGKGEVKEVRIDPKVLEELLQDRDVEMLEDLVVAAVSQAQAKARQQSEDEMRKMTGGLPMPIPGLF